MTTVSENDGTNASWLKKRSSVFNNVTTTNKPAAKVVDKELARLKNMGVSSVWANKFVKEDNSGGTENKNKRISPPPEPPLSPRQQFLMLNKIDISPRPNANYIPGTRQSMTSPPPTSPRSPVFNTRARTLSAASNKKMGEDIHAALEDDTKNNFGYFSKNSVSSLDLNENKRSARSSIASSTTSSVPTSPVVESQAKSVTSIDEAASLWFQCETLKTQFAQSNARLIKANQDIDFYKRQLEQTGELARQAVVAVQEKEVSAPTSPVVTHKSVPSTNADEAASLWFQCETLKTQFAQNDAKLTKANQDIEFYKRQLEQTGELARQAVAAIQEKEASVPTSPVVTPAPADNADEAASLWFQCETLKTQFAQNNAKLTKANQDIEFYKRQLEQTGELARQAVVAVQEKEVSAPTSPVVTHKSVPSTNADEAASLWFQCETLKTQFAQNDAKLTKANQDIEFYKRQLEQTGELARQAVAAIQEKEASVPTSPVVTPTSVPATNVDEAASLWFQCETLKTQFAQSNARLNKANEDIDFYKRQLEQNGEIARQGAAAVAEDKERESLRVRQLAELIVKQDKLLGEYEINLDCLTRLTNESAYLEETQVEMDRLREELSALNKQKLIMEGSIAALRAELEMSYSQMRLMMQVSTEIQNEFDSYKGKIDSDIKELLAKKQEEHDAQIQSLREGLGLSVSRGIDEEEMTKHVDEATAKITAAAAATADLVAADTEKALGFLRNQVNTLTEALEKKDLAVSEALQAKDKAVSEAIEANKALESKDLALSEAIQNQESTVIEMENRLKNQKMMMEAQMMRLNETILEKDTLLMEFMSSRNNSREVISAAASMSPSTVVPAADVTDTYFHQNESRLQINQVRDYMFSSSEDEDEESEVLMMSYSTDEEEHTPRHHDHYRHRLSDTKATSTPQSPADTISSAISFDSDDEEEEKVAEIKHFSYSSVQSQSTRPGSYLSSTGSVSGTDDMDHKRSSLRNSSRISKEVKTASWPMPPPTPPPSEPLPPVPVLHVQEEVHIKEQAPVIAEVKKSNSDVPPPRRARSKTMARDEAPDMSLYTTSVHQNNQLPRIIPVQRELAPIPAPRKDLANLDIQQANELAKAEPQHTKWMDDPESEEDELWCEATATPKQTTQEW